MGLKGFSHKKVALAGAVALAATAGITLAQEKAVYHFYMRKDLARYVAEDSKRVVGQKITVTDELMVIWPETQQRKGTLGGAEHVVFDTTYFHCAVPTNAMGAHLESIWEDAKKGYAEVTKQIEETNDAQRGRDMSASQANEKRRELYWELYRIWSNRPIVTLYGTCDRHDFWGEVRGKSEGVATEAVSIVVDKVEKPRKRWYKSLDD